jgi:hypothetical protein
MRQKSFVFFTRRCDWLTFTSLSRIFLLYGDIFIASEGLQNLGLCLARRAFEQGVIFIVPYLPWYGASVFRSHPKNLPIQLPLTKRKGIFWPRSSQITRRCAFKWWNYIFSKTSRLDIFVFNFRIYFISDIKRAYATLDAFFKFHL